MKPRINLRSFSQVESYAIALSIPELLDFQRDNLHNWIVQAVCKKVKRNTPDYYKVFNKGISFKTFIKQI